MHRVLSIGIGAFVVAAAGTDAPPPAKPAVPRVVQEVAPEQSQAILGQPVLGADGKELGRLVDVLIAVDGAPQAAIIDFGGFLGVGNRRIAVRWDTMRFNPGSPQRSITLDMTMDEIKAAPAYPSPGKPVQVVTPDPAPAAEVAAKHDPAAAAASPAVAPPTDASPEANPSDKPESAAPN